MLRITTKLIAESAMVGEPKVRKDVQRENLNPDSLNDIVRYVYGHRLLAGGLKVFDGVMAGCVSSGGVVDYGEPDDVPIGATRYAVEDDNIEADIRAGMMAQGKTALFCDRYILSARADCGVEYLRSEHLDGLGL